MTEHMKHIFHSSECSKDKSGLNTNLQKISEQNYKQKALICISESFLLKFLLTHFTF